MQLERGARLLATISILSAAVGCATQGHQSQTHAPVQASAESFRGVANIEDNQEMVNAFESLMNDPESAVKARTNYIERLLNIYYKADKLFGVYEAELDSVLAKQKKDPSFEANVVGTKTYKQLIQYRIVTEGMIHKLSYIYGRLLTTVYDLRASSERRGRAERLLNGIHLTLESLPEEDKLQLAGLIDELEEIYNSHDHANFAMPKGDRMPASVQASYQKYKMAYEGFGATDLSQQFKKHQKAMKAKAEIAWKTVDAEADAPLVHEMETERAPSAAAIVPSTGPEGNVIGTQFPKGTWVLTYDDGPGAKSTDRLIGILQAHKDAVNTGGAPASFFWQTKNVLAYPKVVDRVKNANFPLNCHSWSHPDTFGKLGSKGWDKEVDQAIDAQIKAYGTQPVLGTDKFQFYRCPYGACYAPKIPAVRQRIADKNLIHAYWTVDSSDWKFKKNPSKTFTLTQKAMQASKRGIVLFHDIHEGSVDASKLLLDWITKENKAGKNKIRLVTLEQAVAEYNQSLQPAAKK